MNEGQAKPVAGWESTCPTCGGEPVMTCRCMRQDTTCAGGHNWHRCMKHGCVVLGNSHDGGQRNMGDCTCQG